MKRDNCSIERSCIIQFQSYAYGKNHWLLEPDLKPILQKYWADYEKHKQELVEFGILAGGKAYQIADYVDRTAEHAAETTRLAMEIFGGIGFMEDYAIARLHREALVTAIWEGTSNIQALDLLEAMHKKGAHEAFLDEFIPLL